MFAYTENSSVQSEWFAPQQQCVPQNTISSQGRHQPGLCSCPTCTPCFFPSTGNNIPEFYPTAQGNLRTGPVVVPQQSTPQYPPCIPPSLYDGSLCQCDDCVRQSKPTSMNDFVERNSLPQREAFRPSEKLHRDVAVSDESFQRVVGQMFDLARTSGGSSFLQACLKDRESDRFGVIYSELRPHFAELLLDSHGCYVMRSLMELMTQDGLHDILQTISQDDQLIFSLCTHSLHTRRIIQFLLEAARVETCQFIVDAMVKYCREIATTQQGCIAMQRVMDCAAPGQSAIIYARVYELMIEFAHDPFANYVVQYILENGDKTVTSAEVWKRFEGNVTALACNKFASNVVEKALHHTLPDVQHMIIAELYSNSCEFLQGMLQDSFGNYIVQATIALCSFKDVWMISEKLKPILHTTPYGYKIAARLERRLKGKPLTNARTVTYNQSQLLRS